MGIQSLNQKYVVPSESDDPVAHPLLCPVQKGDTVSAVSRLFGAGCFSRASCRKVIILGNPDMKLVRKSARIADGRFAESEFAAILPS
jgi:hypothetical protein